MSASQDVTPASRATRESQRRLSPPRVLVAVLVTAALVAIGVFGVQWWSAQSAPIAKPWFAGYVDVTATPQFAFEKPGASDAPDNVLSFVVSSKEDPCTPTWGGAYTLDQARGSLDLDRRIARLQQQGGNIAVSFGGQLNNELAVGCTDSAQLVAAYSAVVDRYRVGTIDLDLEGQGLADAAAGERRAKAIAALQKQRRADGDGLAVWVTLPVAPSGLSSEGTDAIATLLAKGVDLAGVNVMTMDYGSSRAAGQSMIDATTDALTAAHRQLGVLYKRAGVNLSDRSLWNKIGVTPMIGQNDVKDEVFSLADAAKLNDFAVKNGIGRMSMWSTNRDKTCGSNYVNLTIVSDACSGVAQGKKTFGGVLSTGFDGRISLGETVVTTSDPTAAAQEKDDPATSPYPIWAASSSYLKGTKVVWHHAVYAAKWWTKGDLPDDPVLNEWDTPWQLVGPVLPGETPIKQPTLPEGTYPDWNGAATYDTGARVLQDGVPFEAKWWNQAESPAAASSAPDSSPWSPLTQDEINQVVSDGSTDASTTSGTAAG